LIADCYNMSQAKPRRRQSSPAQKLRELEAREPIFKLFAKRLGRRTVQRYLFGTDAEKEEALRRAEYQVKVIVGDKQWKDFLITKSPESTFDAVLKEAKVPLAPK
jgi:hypothetical protein